MEQVSSTLVCVSGSVLSSLLFKLRNTPGDSEGFLIGEVCKRSVDAITDSQCSGVREEKKIHIQSFVSFDRRFSFYDHFGIPDFQKIEEELGVQYQHLIGWFSFRRNTSHRISLREKAIQRKLFDGLDHVTKKDFLFGLVTESLVELTPIHSTEYSFYTWNGTSPKVVGVEVINLRGSGAVPYQSSSISRDMATQSNYASISLEQNSHFLNSDGQVSQAVAVESLYKSILQRLQPLASELAQSNKDVISLGEEVTRLQELVDELKEEAVEKETEDPNKSEEDFTTLINLKDDSAPTKNLIDLNSPGNREGVALQSHDPVQNITELTASGSHDLLTEVNPAMHQQTGLLQPLVLPSNEEEHKQDEDIDLERLQESSNNSFIQQSQELF